MEQVPSPQSPVPRHACACEGFKRSEFLSRGAAQAGQGLPSIEAGMPVPAGTGLSRRSFILRTAGLALSIYGATALGPEAFEAGIAAAAQGPPDAVLVSVFMAGGVDGMTLLAPVGHSRYRTLRPTLALLPTQGTPFSEDTSLHWHPSASSMATLHSEGKVSTFPAIGYTDANQSHFTSRHYWEVGETNPFGRIGWLGRYLDQHGAPDNPLQGLTLGWDLSPALASGSVPVATVSQPDQYDLDAPGVWGPIPDPMHDAFTKLGELTTSDSGLKVARDATAATGRLREQLEPFQSGFTTPAGVTYPSGDAFPRRLAGLAAMLAAGLPLRAVALEAPGGYDTHSNQLTDLPGNLQLTSDSLLAFQRDLEARGLADRVLTHVWSEFGRRPEENGSGTDHGAAGSSLLIGTKAKGTMVGGFPGLTTLDEDDNLRNTSDFRGLYCALLEDWLGVDAAPVIPNASSFTRPAILK
jgi:uncharacterized protein (DUF1501 family)